MKIGIIADSHDNLPKIVEAFKKINEEKIDFVIHLGDYVAPFTIRKINEIYSGKLIGIFGNNDGDKILLSKTFDIYKWEIYEPPKLIEIENKKFLLFHSLPDLEKIEFNIPYILFAHTHRVYIKKGNCNILNPGELCGYLTGNSTFLILDINKNEERIIKIE